ncbi:MAG: hypothetical protein KFF68_01680, partial [Desulfosarcina sp.]|nr:hypothetical protein [Desulfosarcina sp.]
PVVFIAAARMVVNRSVQIPDEVSNKQSSTIRGMIGYDDPRMVGFMSKITLFANCKIMSYAKASILKI